MGFPRAKPEECHYLHQDYNPYTRSSNRETYFFNSIWLTVVGACMHDSRLSGIFDDLIQLYHMHACYICHCMDILCI